MDDHPVEYILDALDAEMSAADKPKVLLFDLGGVCVVSPFQAILDYELSLGIPPGWVNFSISKSAPEGFFHRLEMGRIPMDSGFFTGFNQDLHNPVRWRQFYEAQRAKNPTLPEELQPMPKMDGEWLFNEMMARSSQPDPWMYPALKKLKASGKFMLAALSNTVIFPPRHPLYREDFMDDPLRSLFDVFISSAHVGLRKPDQKVYDLALKKVNEFAKANADTTRGRAGDWANRIKGDEVLFLDDIGENLKAARKYGFQTLRVYLGRAFEAVEQLEEITGLQLEGDHSKIPVKPRMTAKI